MIVTQNQLRICVKAKPSVNLCPAESCKQIAAAFELPSMHSLCIVLIDHIRLVVYEKAC